MRNVGGITARFQEINLEKIIKKTGISLAHAIDHLKQLHAQGDADIQQLHVDSGISFHVPREDKRSLLPILQQLDVLTNEKKRLADTVCNYATKSGCYRKRLLHYFGESRKNSCDHCSNCNSNITAINTIINNLKEVLSREEPLSLEQLSQHTSYKREELVLALNEMCNEEMVIQFTPNQFKLL